MSVIIRLQNLPWSANALDIRNFFRGLSIPEGGVHIVGGEFGDAFIAFSTDEDARQAMMLDCGKIKEIQVKLLLSSRSEMHKVIEAARQSVPILTLSAPAPAPAAVPQPALITAPAPAAPLITPFSAALGAVGLAGFGIPGIGNPGELPQPAVIEPPAPRGEGASPVDHLDDDDKTERRRSKDKDRRRSRSRSRSRDRKDRKRDRRDRSRSRERRRRDRSRSRDRRDRKRDRKDRSRSRDRSPSRRSRSRKSPQNGADAAPLAPAAPAYGVDLGLPPARALPPDSLADRFDDPAISDAYNKLSELGKKRNPNAFQGEPTNQNGRFQGGGARGGANFRREGRSRFDNEPQADCCVAVRNAPNHTSYGDVRRFFPFLIDKHGIKMINDSTGRRTGNIYVRFCDPRSRQLALQRRLNELKGAPVQVEPLDDRLYEAAVDSFLPFRDEAPAPAASPAAALSLAAAAAPSAEPEPASEPAAAFTVLRLTELPHFVKEHDIIKLFSDFSLLSIMLTDCRETRSKTAHVQFAKAEDAAAALQRRDGYSFARRRAVLAPVDDADYEREKAAQSERGLPSPPAGAGAQSEPHADTEPPERAEPPPRDPRQRRQFDAPTRPALAHQPGPPFFGSPFAPPQARFGPPFVGNQFGGFPGGGGGGMGGGAGFPAHAAVDEEEELDCVLMKGLPRDATDRTIVSFLADTGAVPARIHLMLEPGGAPSGDCFCEFRSAQEARRAATKHGHGLDGCRVTVDPVPRSVVEEALEGPKQPEPSQGILGPQPYFDEPRGAKRGGFRGRGGFDRGGFDGSRGGFDRGGFDGNRGGFDRGGFNGNRGGFDGSRGGFDGNRGGFDGNRGGFDGGRVGFDRGGFNGGRGWNDRGRGRGGFDRGGGRGRGRGGFENGGGPREMRSEEPDSTLEDFGAPGCVLALENVPFRASVDDILAFFNDFELTQDDVIRRYNDRGQPTGDARVAFRTPFDAQRALKTRHMNQIQDRRVSLTLL